MKIPDISNLEEHQRERLFAVHVANELTDKLLDEIGFEPCEEFGLDDVIRGVLMFVLVNGVATGRLKFDLEQGPPPNPEVRP